MASAFDMAMYTWVALGIVGAIKWVYDHARLAIRNLKDSPEE